jgi:hypothetical protein
VRMTQPKFAVISRLARSTMLSKILTAFALGEQFWIKDQRRAKPQLCVLELDALYVLSEASGSYSPASRQCFARTF